MLGVSRLRRDLTGCLSGVIVPLLIGGCGVRKRNKEFRKLEGRVGKPEMQIATLQVDPEVGD